MQFISYIASTMLIVLISQHSIMGLPVNDTVVNKSCSEGFELIEGQCMPIKSELQDNITESSSLPSNDTITEEEKPVVALKDNKRFGSCPEGMTHGEHGICKDIISHDQLKPVAETTEAAVGTTEAAVETTEAAVESSDDTGAKSGETAIPKGCPENTKPDEQGLCQEIKPSNSRKMKTDPKLLKKDGSCPDDYKMIQGQCMPIKPKLQDNIIESSSLPSDNIITEEEKPVVVPKENKRLGSCPEGMTHGEHGICKNIISHDQLKSVAETTEAPVESSDDRGAKSGEIDIPKGCPENTKPDEQGSCQEIKPSNSRKMKIDPKLLLKKDGSCPDDYKMIQGQCLYIKPKKNSKLYSNYLAADDNVPSGLRPKPYDSDKVQYESVSVLADNSCPEGTEYYEYGLCRRRVYPSQVNVPAKVDVHCPDNSEFVNGKCSPKKTQAEELEDITKETGPSKSNIKPISYDEPTRFTTEMNTVGDSNMEFPSESTTMSF